MPSNRNYIPLILGFLFCGIFMAGCSPVKFVPEGDYLLQNNQLDIASAHKEEDVDQAELEGYLRQQPNTTVFFGWKIPLSFYSLHSRRDSCGWDRFVDKIGEPPVIFDSTLIRSSAANVNRRLENLGYYYNKIQDSIILKKKRAKVVYTVFPGRSYLIDSILYHIEDSSVARILFADTTAFLIRSGQRLALTRLENEAERVNKLMRSRGYYQFTKNHIAFRADTLEGRGKAQLHYHILNHSRNKDSSEAIPHKIYTLRNISIFPDFRPLEEASENKPDSLMQEIHFKGLHFYYPGKINIRPKTIRRLNLLDSGQIYNEELVNTTYRRFSSVRVFNGVTMLFNARRDSLTGVENGDLDCSIRLNPGKTQGYKIGMEVSSNSNGLVGVSPELNYYHKNIFRGGEWLSLGFMGNFQFKFNDPTRSTEFGTSASLSFPKLLFPVRVSAFIENTPRTDFSASYNYQKRPEYTRNMASFIFGYNWRAGEKLYVNVNPVRFNIVKLYNMSQEFLTSLHDPFLLDTYRDHFDLGAEASLYYTTDPSVVHRRSYFYLRAGMNSAGNLLSLFNSAMKKDSTSTRTIGGIAYSQYIKADLSAVYTKIFNNIHSLAFRAYAGIGIPYGNASSLPLEQQFYSGGANSLRAWQARTIGPGSMPADSTFAIPNQTGNLKFELNAEYRFRMFWKIEGALFADAGNIWNTGHKSDLRKEGIFRFKDFYESIAVDSGLGLRLNMDFVILRLDFAVILRDPELKQWIGPGQWFTKDNYAFQFGVGYPF